MMPFAIMLVQAIPSLDYIPVKHQYTGASD